ncbi:MAG: HAD family hydrolase [Deinococcales bacterium]|jgi:Cof subfamily protein (haloacid dehalogenase superfamily)
MIPLVVLDLDGTLIGSQGAVQGCVWEATERVRESGVKLIVCTGRPAFGVALRVAQRLGPTAPHIFQSGAHIAYPDGETLKASALKEATARRLLSQARKLGIVLELYTPSNLFVERKTPMSEAHAKMLGVTAIVRDLEDVVANEPVVRAQWVVPVDQVPSVRSASGDDVQVSTATSPALLDTAFVSVTALGVSKASAVRHVAAVLRLRLDEVMAVGDSLGDVPMLELVGHPVVMANSSPELLARFSDVAGDVESCGVVAALEEALALGRP